MNPYAADPTRRALIPELWPASDLAAWISATSTKTSLFAKTGRASKWTGATCRSVSQSYGRWLGFLERTGRLDRKSGPGERIVPEYLEDYFLHLKACGNRRATIVKRFGHLAMALQVMVPGIETSLITCPDGVGLGYYLPDDCIDKRLFDSRTLLDLSMALFHQGLAMRSNARRRTAIRDAALLGLLAVCAPRNRTLHAMEEDFHLTRGSAAYHIHFLPKVQRDNQGEKIRQSG